MSVLVTSVKNFQNQLSGKAVMQLCLKSDVRDPVTNALACDHMAGKAFRIDQA